MDKELVQMLSQALADTNINTTYYYAKDMKKVIQVSGNQPLPAAENLIKIEPMLDDIVELMEDFALEQDAEDVQEQLLKTLQNRNIRTGIINFKRILHDFPRSKKSWAKIEEKWLKERAMEFIEDIDK